MAAVVALRRLQTTRAGGEIHPAQYFPAADRVPILRRLRGGRRAAAEDEPVVAAPRAQALAPAPLAPAPRVSAARAPAPRVSAARAPAPGASAAVNRASRASRPLSAAAKAASPADQDFMPTEMFLKPYVLFGKVVPSLYDADALVTDASALSKAIERGLDPNAPLSYVAGGLPRWIFRRDLKAGPRGVRYPLLHALIMENNLEGVRALVKCKRLQLERPAGAHSRPALLFALKECAKQKHVGDIIVELVKAGARLVPPESAAAGTDECPLTCIMARGAQSAAEAVLRMAPRDYLTGARPVALVKATTDALREVLDANLRELRIPAGVDLRAEVLHTDSSDVSGLSRWTRVACILLLMGADVNMALASLVRRQGDVSFLRLLLRCGADPHTGKDGERAPFEIAFSRAIERLAPPSAVACLATIAEAGGCPDRRDRWWPRLLDMGLAEAQALHFQGRQAAPAAAIKALDVSHVLSWSARRHAVAFRALKRGQLKAAPSSSI